MKRIEFCFVALSIIALALVPTSTIGQSTSGNSNYSPLDTSRAPAAQRSLKPQTKFVRSQNPVPNKYIFILNDDLASNPSVAVRRAQVTSIANALARAHAGKVGFIYETALKGFSIELPNETAAMAVSQNPQVQWVEEVGLIQISDVQYNPPSWGLDRVDQMDLPLNGQYVYNSTGSGINAYIIDTGIRSTHV